MKLRIIIPLTILLLFSYLIFVFPFETIALWLGHATSYQETILSTAFVYLVCLYYFRSKSSNKLIKFFVYEGMGIGTISLFIVIFILIISLVITISDTQKILIYFLTFFPSIIYGFINAKKVSIKQLKFSHAKIKKNLSISDDCQISSAVKERTGAISRTISSRIINKLVCDDFLA